MQSILYRTRTIDLNRMSNGIMHQSPTVLYLTGIMWLVSRNKYSLKEKRMVMCKNILRLTLLDANESSVRTNLQVKLNAVGLGFLRIVRGKTT